MDQKPEYSNDELVALEREYAGLAVTAATFCDEVDHQLDRLLRERQIALGFPIQRRVKPWSSLLEKLGRVSFKVTAVQDLQDLIGLRIIVLFKRDVATVCEVISHNFRVVRKYDTQERMKDDRFGYSSVHFVVELRADWLAVPSLSGMSGLKAETQVRTVAQHTWAEASNNLQYKKAESVPPSVARSINRLSALLETVDLEFERMLADRESYRSQVDITGTPDLLNVDLVEKTLDSLLPQANKGNEEYAELLDELTRFGLRTQQQLRELVTRHLAEIFRTEIGAVASYQQHARANRTPLNERLDRGVFFNHVGLTRMALKSEFAQFDEYLKEKIAKRDSPGANE